MSIKTQQAVIYTTRTCPYCRAAKKLLESNNIAFEEMDVSDDDAMRGRLVKMTGGRETVPQIFIDGKAIGGYEDLVKWLG